MQIAAVQAECSRLSPATAKAIAENAALIDEVQREIRTMSYLLHPPLLDELGLRSALHWYIDGFAARSNIKTTLELPPDLARLPREMELCIFRIAQECLTNIHRHSGSGVAAIRIAQQDGMLHVEVRDQGRGITPEKQLSLAATDKRGVGIPGMQERVRQFGGSLEIESNASGTAVVAMFPLAPACGKEKIAVATSSKS
jgi:signal transduction histidine kinase